ncbi:MAG: sulfatase [Planctomycetota bacterium]|jgi:arylsulfatase A-like enzyme
MKVTDKMNRRDFLSRAGATATWALLPVGCSKSDTSKRRSEYSGPVRHVIIISLDTLRTDHLGCYGNNWIHTPRIDALAAESILFANYMTVVPTTLASHTTLFTGKYPHSHGTPRNGFMVNQDNVMLAEILKGADFDTIGIPGSFALDSRFSFSRGFDYYDENFDRLVGDQGAFQNERPAKSVTDTAIKYLDNNGIPRNLFLFAHYFDPHAPLTPSSPYNRIYVRNEAINDWIGQTQGQDNLFAKSAKVSLYAGEVSYMDVHIGRLLDYLKNRGILDEAILILTSDHGENFWDHPTFWNHGWTVYQTTMDAVCMIRLPGGDKANMKVNQLLASIDILPTLLNYLGLAIPEAIDGEAINLTNSDISFPTRIRFGQATKPGDEVEIDPRWYNIHKARYVRDGNLKYIQTPYARTEELYDLSVDPYERNSLLKKPTPQIATIATELREKLQAWAESAHPLASRFEKSQREETVRRLKSLGYLK